MDKWKEALWAKIQRKNKAWNDLVRITDSRLPRKGMLYDYESDDEFDR